jgi:Domain of unknown function (DUF4159)
VDRVLSKSYFALPRRSLLLVGAILCLCTLCSLTWAFQRGWSRRSSNDREGVPVWNVNPNFKQDVFTFARVQYSDGYQGYDERYGRRGRGGNNWRIDHPTSDLNFSLRLQQLTSIQVNPYPAIVRLSDSNLGDYPFLYLIEPGSMALDPDEVKGLREYCLKGGFMMVDDFWGEYEYKNLYKELKKVFPDREPREVPLEHEIFQCVYPLKEKPQVPSVNAFRAGLSHEPRPESDTSSARYLAFEDDSSRIMIFICHNTDLGDGWEREGENRDYFAEHAVKKSYPLGINIVTYAMTH